MSLRRCDGRSPGDERWPRLPGRGALGVDGVRSGGVPGWQTSKLDEL